jgi:hypothetical protein
MKECGREQTTTERAAGEGSGVTVAISQAASDPGGWRISVFATLHGTETLIARQILAARAADSPANRVLFVGSAPGASEWSVLVEGPVGSGPSLGVGVWASDCCTPPTLCIPLQV